jgi:group I intron endonuclease
MIGIYKITSPTKRVYIGQSIDIERRFKAYQNIKKSKGQTAIHNSFKKHGIEKHIFTVILECEITELNDKERYYQDLFQCIGKNGLNCNLTKSSDRSGKHSKESLLKMSVAQKGRKHTEETKLLLSEISKKRIITKERIKPLTSYWKGKKRSETDKINKSINSPRFWLGKKQSKESSLKKSLNSSKHKSKIVLDFNTGIFYESAKECSVINKIAHSTFRSMLNGRLNNKTSFKYV